MANQNLFINQASLDSFGSVWCVGRNVNKFDGDNWFYYNSTNSAVPSSLPYFKDTRSISIDPQNNKWVGCAVTSGIGQDLVFYLSGESVEEGESWDLSNFGSLSSISPNWEVPTIYGCPYGNDVLAFISPLNGGGGTGATGDVGTTGGYLWRYDKFSKNWEEVVQDYTWPHIYDITALGTSNGDYEYYLCTSDGLQIIPDGKIDSSVLLDGLISIPNLIKKNTSNSGIGSNIVYSISFDENANYWLGTQNGLVYWDGQKYYRWDVGGGLGVTKVVARKNGHVFFKIGDPTLVTTSVTDGFYHFNGDTFTNYNQSNSDLIDDRVVDLMLVQEKSNFSTSSAYPGDLWIVSGNNLVLFDYQIPHIYATSKYVGSTGWNFVYYTPTSEGATTDHARLPKADKYTWTFPTWTNRDLNYLITAHPGMDPRNLFLETDFKDIANNRAGEQAYWNNGPVIPIEDQDLAKKIPSNSWLQDTSPFTVTSTCKFRGYNVVTGYSDSPSIVLGQSSNLEESYTLLNPNPTDSSGSPNPVGFIAFYTDGGQVLGCIPFRGSSTYVFKAVPSLDDSTLYVAGAFKKYIEAGKFVYSSEYPGAPDMTATGVSGPTGSPIGFSNIATPGITSSYDYPWILNGPTGATSGIYLPDTSILVDRYGFFLAEVDFDLGNQTSYGGIDFSQGETPQSSYCLKNFRYFPGASSVYDPRPGVPTADSPNKIGSVDLAVSKNSVRMTVNYSGGISLLKNQYGNFGDMPQSPDFIFTNFFGPNYTDGGTVIDLDSYLDLKNGVSIGDTGPNTQSLSLDKISGLPDSLTYLLTGTSKYNVSSPGISLIHPKPGYAMPFFILNSSSNSALGGSFIKNSDKNAVGFQNWRNTISPFKSGSQYYLDFLYTGNAIFSNSPNGNIITSPGASGSLNLGTLSVKPGGYYSILSNYEVLPESYEDTYYVSQAGSSDANTDNDYYSSFYYPKTPGSTEKGHLLIKRNVTGTFIDDFSTFPVSCYSVDFQVTGFNPPVNGAIAYYFSPVSGAILINASQSGLDISGTLSNIPAASFTISITDSAGNTGSFVPSSISNLGSFFQINYLNGSVTGTLPTNMEAGAAQICLTPLAIDQFGLKYHVSSNSDLFVAGSYYGNNGPLNLPYEGGTGSFVSLLESYKPQTGKSMGEIISRAGSGAWTWFDVHNSERDLYVPMLSTVFLSNYDSKIFGKRNNRWVLSNSKTGEILLDVKNVPYFIYTFTRSGYYSIVNSVEDSAGNVYEISKPAMIKVVNQSIPLADDPNPEYVNSADYGYVETKVDRNSKSFQLAEDLSKERLEILFDNRIQFGSGIFIPDNPDATFNQY
jgi:hypothetical protein